jgi:hypothetical protein
MKPLVKVTVPKTKAELVQALSAASVRRMRVDLVSGSKLDDATAKTVADWRRGKSRVLVVVLDLGTGQ